MPAGINWIPADLLFINRIISGNYFLSIMERLLKQQMRCMTMTTAQLLKNLEIPTGRVDVILDTDCYNEIDDQFALAYILKSGEKMNLKGIVAAPFLNGRSVSPADGMEKSYQEILKLLKIAGRDELIKQVYRGSEQYLPDENTPVVSAGAAFLAEQARAYSPENPLYIVAIGAITNVASALLMEPLMKENTVIIWLGGTAHEWKHNQEFNLRQDVAAARVVFGCGVPLIQFPCAGVVDHFLTTRYELEHWLSGKNALCDYLVDATVAEAEGYAAGRPWSRAIWDVTAAAWLMDEKHIFFDSEIRHSPIPEYDDRWSFDNHRHFMCYITTVNRDPLMEDLFSRLAKD